MSPPGRPKGEYRSAEHEGTPPRTAPVVEATDLKQVYTIRRGMFREPARPGGRRRFFAIEAVERWRWSANPVAASRRWRVWCR